MVCSFAPGPVSAKERPPRQPAPVAVTHVSIMDYEGWSGCFKLSNGKTQVIVVPDIGGRIMDYSLEGESPLFVNKAEMGKLYPITKTWHNYGGFKNWQAPQDRWGWPPDPYLDYGRATVEVLNPETASPTLRVTGAPSIGAGLVFVRDISLDPATGDLTISQSLTNLSTQNQQWSVWDVTQTIYPCIVAVPMNPQSAFPAGSELLSDGRNNEVSQWHPSDGTLLIRPNGKEGKVGLDPANAWMAWFRDRLAYVKKCPARIAEASYPDKGANLEVFTSTKELRYTEMEVLSPLFNLPPGASGSLVEQWQIRRLGFRVRSDQDVARALKTLALSP